jgi:hypothetical protein
MNDSNATVKIMDLLGRTIQQTTIRNGNETVDASTLTGGSYLVEIIHNNKIYKTKLVVQ